MPRPSVQQCLAYEKSVQAEFAKAVRSGAPRSSAARKTGDLQLSGLHLDLRNKQRRTIPDQTENPTHRMRAKLKEIKEEMRQRRHHSIPEQGHWLKQVVTGFFAYHAVPTNIWSLGTFRSRIIDLWRRSLRRRSQKDGTTWRRITKLANDFLPRARILHPWPQERFAVKYPRWE